MMHINIEFSLESILDILSISTAFMLGLLFITIKSNNRRANLSLGFFLWSLSIEVLSVFSHSIDGVSLHIPQSSLFTIPFLFLYVNQTFNKHFQFIFLLLFIPGLIINTIIFSSLHIEYLEYLFNISILLLIIVKLKNHQKKVGDFYSDIENKTLSWIKMIVYVFLFFHLLWIVEDLLSLQNDSWTIYFASTSNILTFFMIYWIGYNGFSQSKIFTSSLFLLEERVDHNTENLSETKNEFEKIYETILKEKLFTNTHLNLRSLSLHLNLKEKELSKLINLHTEQNFYHFINQFRVNEFKRLLLMPKAKQLTLLGLSEEAGFSSKSTFYTAFKKLEGVTPKQFQNQLKKSE